MSRWFRHYAGMVRDDKLVRIAIRSKQPIERVVWVWGAILESACELNADGHFEVDSAEIARFLAIEVKHVRAILKHLTDAGHIYRGVITKWADRQFKSDKSAARTAKYRENKRTSRDGAVTSQPRHGDAPETETETETDYHPSQEGSSLGVGTTRDGFRVIGGGK